MPEENEQRYEPAAIEAKWQQRWDADPALYAAEPPDCGKPKYYVLEMLPYPSGTLHIGHIRNYSIGDALARYKWMRGFNVLHPMGWDAFGLPAENAAIANKVPPREWTLRNIAAMKKTHRRFGFSYDWDREVSTCEPEYYRWNQWFFLEMLKRGLAYRKRALVNWCPKCATVLANEQVVEGCCWRHDTTPVEQRALEQWFLKITAFAQELLDAMAQLTEGWPERVLTMQRNWIGRSEGAEIDFHLAETGEAVRVFTTGTLNAMPHSFAWPGGTVNDRDSPATAVPPTSAAQRTSIGPASWVSLNTLSVRPTSWPPAKAEFHWRQNTATGWKAL